MNIVKQNVRRFFLLLVAMCVLVGGVASAKTRRPRKPKPAPATVEMECCQAKDKDADRPIRAGSIKPERKAAGVEGSDDDKKVVPAPGPRSFGPPVELKLTKASGSGKRIDLRRLPHTPPPAHERVELEGPEPAPVAIENPTAPHFETGFQPPIVSNAPAPAPTAVYEGLDRFNWGAGSPPDTNGDAGTTYYVQTVNTSIGVFRKSDGFQEAAFTFNTFMSQGNFGNLCDTNNFGDPVVLYDTFEDRWVITDFAFLTDISGNVLAPAYECFAVSMNGNPLTGGWNFYSTQVTDNLNDYPKLGVWPDGIYMSANMFSFGAGSSFKGARAWAFNKAQMYAGSPTVKVVTFDIPGGDFAVMPSNARLQTGTPPPGRPNLFVSTWQFLNALTVYKFKPDWNNVLLSTFTGPDVPLAATSWPNAAVANVPQSGTTQLLDALQIRAMVQNQYTNFGGVESLWVPHTVRRGNTTGFAAPRWYQVDVTGGTVAANLPQATTWDPDAANVMHRWMPSLALDRTGNMLMGYSTSNSSTFPSIKYAGRVAADPVNTFSLTEQTFFTGTASQLSSTRWGDYSSMTLDPDGCTFWYTTEYATGLDNTTVDPTSFNKRWKTKFGSIPALPGCVPVGAGGTVSGTVTVNPGGAPIAGATVNLSARSATTDGSGNYSFPGIPAGTYPTIGASKGGFGSASASSIAVTDGGTTTQNFSLTAAPASACLTDTTQSDFLTANAITNVDLNTSPGDVTLSNAPTIDQQNTAGTTTGTGFATTSWGGQTFIPAVTGQLVKTDVQLFCSGCTGTTPNLTLSVRATSAGLPTGADLASATIPGFSSGAGTYYSATFGAPATLTSGTQYALILRPVAAPSVGGYFWIRASPSSYANGQRVISTDNGVTWTADSTRDFNFKAYMQVGYAASGNLVSSVKDANPAGGITPIWSTLSWNASTPANTSLKFQVAASNNSGGPFNFVGPDGTAGTFFTTSPASLAQFYNFRYVEYKAFLASTNSAVTSTLNDATMCFNDVDCSGAPAITPSPAAVCANSTGNTASGPAGMNSYSWSITNGSITGGGTSQTVTYTAGASGTVGLLLNVVLPNGCHQSNSTNVTINPIPATPTITPTGPTTVTYPNTVALNSSSATGNQWYLGGNPIATATNQAYTASASGDYTVIVTQNNCVSPTSSITTVTINPATPVVTATGGTFSYDGTPKAGSGSATGGAGETLTVTLTYTGTGSTTYGPSSTAPTLVGTYNVTAHTPGDANNTSGDSAPAALSITQANPNISATGGTFTYDGNPKSGSGSATGGGGEVLPVTLTYNGTGATTYGPTATAPSLAGTYTVTAHTPGDANNAAADSSPTALTINKFDPLMAAHGGTFTYNGFPEVGTGQAIGGAGENLPVTLTYQGISGTTWGPTATAPTNVGVYLVTAHTVGDANNNAKDSLPNALRINKASATVVVTGYCVSFDGSAHTAASSATGVIGESLAAGLVVTATTHTAAGTYSGDAWTFSGSPNYNDQNGTVNDSIVDATITTPSVSISGSTGNTASVPSAGAGATYNWGITNGTITAGTGTSSITFTAGAVGTLTLNVTVTNSLACGTSKSANVTVAPAITLTSVTPSSGPYFGVQPVTINGSGFVTGTTVTFGGAAATQVVVVSGSQITAKTPAHSPGAVNVTATLPNTQSATLTNGYTYQPQIFDPNGDNVVDPSDIFFLVNYLFLGGPAPHGAAGMPSGDANRDGIVDPSDIFYVVNYLFGSGPRPWAVADRPATEGVTASAKLSGGLKLGEPELRDGRMVVPVVLTMDEGSETPQAFSVVVKGGNAIHRAGGAEGLKALFEINRAANDSVVYLLSIDPRTPLTLGADRTAVIAEIEVSGADSRVSLDGSRTLLSNLGGTRTATTSNGMLHLDGERVIRVPKSDLKGTNAQ